MANTKNPMANLVGSNIKKERERQRLSQRQLADDIGVTVATLSRIENGVHYPSERNLEAIARMLKKQKEFFFQKIPEALPQSGIRTEDHHKAIMEIGALRAEVETLKQKNAEHEHQQKEIEELAKNSFSFFAAKLYYDLMYTLDGVGFATEAHWKSFFDSINIDYDEVHRRWEAFRSSPEDILKKK